ncbi:MAG: hypothetical protein MUC88_02675 [Planctomycetes bacterium]|jgi:hypothetical protein|nr:hypothetical protein [Planctomycetota bacterium]
MSLSKSIILASIVVVGLAAGTVLVAGYVNKPSTPAPVACPGDCDGCPWQGTDACCKTDKPGCCAKTDQCASACPKATCEKAAGCCPQEAPAAPCPPPDCGGCGLGKCPRTE